MSKQNGLPFDPNALAKWLAQGLKDTLQYRINRTLNKEKVIEFIQANLPNRQQVAHFGLKKTLIKLGFSFEPLKLGDAHFQLLRKKYRNPSLGQPIRRLLLIPGFGDSPGSWITPFGFAKHELLKRYDEVLILDFPGYLGFLSRHPLVPSMQVFLSAVKMVCESNPPTALVGHSLGGWLAAKIAQSLEKPFEHLVVIAPSGLVPERERKSFADFILSTQDLELEALLEKIVHQPKRYHGFLKKEFNGFYSKPEVRDFIQSVKPDEFIHPDLPFRCQKLSVIWGESDAFVPHHWLRYWIESYGVQAHAYLLKNTGHLPQLESPKVLAEVVVNALLDRPEKEGKQWKRIHSRVSEFQSEPIAIRLISQTEKRTT